MNDIKKDYEALRIEHMRLVTENGILREELDYFKRLIQTIASTHNALGGKEE